MSMDSMIQITETIDTLAEIKQWVSTWNIDHGSSAMSNVDWYCQQIVQQYTSSNALESLINKSTTYSNFPALEAFSNFIGTALQPTAYIIAIMFFLLALVDLGMSERMNIETFVKFFAKLACAIFLIENFDYMLKFASGVEQAVGEALTNGLSKLTDSGAYNLQDMVIANIPETWYGRLMGVMTQHVYSFANTIGFGFMLTFLLSRLMELSIRGGFMPIAFAFVTEEGWRGTAIRYFKKYIALLCVGPTVSVVLLMGRVLLATLQGSIGASLNTGAVLVIVITVAEVGMVKKSQDLLNEIFGV